MSQTVAVHWSKHFDD